MAGKECDCKVKYHGTEFVKKGRDVSDDLQSGEHTDGPTERVYELRLVTSKRSVKQNDCGITCQLICKNGITKPFAIQNVQGILEEKAAWLKSVGAFVTGNVTPVTYSDLSIVTDENIGPLLGLSFSNESDHDGAWFLSYVWAKSQGSVTAKYPTYKWLQKGNKLYATSQTSLLTDLVIQNHPNQAKIRRAQVSMYSSRYEWQPWDMGPTYWSIEDYSALDIIAGMHLDERWAYEKFKDYGLAALKAALPVPLKMLEGDYSSFSDFADYWNALEGIEMDDGLTPDFLCGGRWMHDRELGRQMLNGINPNLIARCICLPEHFKVTTEMVQDSLCRGLILEQELKEGNVYIVDMTYYLTDLPCGRICPAPTGLFYVKPSGHLYPIAIQLEPNGVIFTPNDPFYDWLQAKIYFQCGNWQVHEVIDHALLTHFIAETLCVATKRNLPLAHPIYRLLNEHFVGTLFINAAARAVLVNPGGLIDSFASCGGNDARGIIELGKRGYNKFSLLGLAIPIDLAKRGVADRKKLPNYHYRDDALQVWGAMEKMVRGNINLFYKVDSDVAKDPELQAWLYDLTNNGFPSTSDLPKMPSDISTIDGLVTVLTSIVWICSARHNSVNSGQYQMFGFSPNAPSVVNAPVPKSKTGATLESVLKALPTKADLFNTIVTVLLLSQYFQQNQLGKYDEVMFLDSERPWDVLVQFSRDLKVIEKAIKDRNAKLEVPYVYLLPSNLVNSISI